MKRLKSFLFVFIFTQLGYCFARVIQKYISYTKNPALFEQAFQPWYTGLYTTLTVIGISLALTVIAYFAVGYFIKKETKNNRKY